MRILRVKVENLNSLYGPHEVDLARDLAGAPLFLIRGPTGAGKSTLLDAVALALFGRTARLERAVGKGGDRLDADDPRGTLSTDTGSGYAEVDFSVVREGVREHYRARWSVRKARNKPDGNFQAPWRSLSRLVNGEEQKPALVESDRQSVQDAFRNILRGMEFRDFTRSVLLAQGEFQAFLKASESERAELLERLSDVSLFRRVGEAAAARHGEAREALLQGQAGLEAIRVLGPDEVEALTGEAEAAGARRREAQMTRERRAREARTREAFARALGRWEEAGAGVAEAEAREAGLAGTRELLARHEAAAAVVTCGEAVARLGQQVEGREARLVALSGEVEAAAALCLAAEAACADAATGVVAAEAERDRMRPILEGVRERLATHARQAQQLAVAERNLKETLAARDAARARQVEAEGRLEKALDAELRGTAALSELCLGATEGDFRASVAQAEQELVALEAAERRAEGARTAAREAGLRVAAAGQARAEAEALREAARERRGSTETAQRAAMARLAELTGGDEAEAALEALEQAEREARERGERLGRAAMARARQVNVAAAGTRLGEALATAREATREARARQASLEEAVARHAAEVEQLAEAERHLLGVVEVARQRGLLRTGEACPLCGSPDHPYADGHGSPPDEAPQLALSARLSERRGREEAARDARSLELKQLQLQPFVSAEARAEAACEAHAEALSEATAGWQAAAREAGLDTAVGESEADAALRESQEAAAAAAGSAERRRRALREALGQAAEAEQAGQLAAHGLALAEARVGEAGRTGQAAAEAQQAAAAAEVREVEAREVAAAALARTLGGLGPEAGTGRIGVEALAGRAAKVPGYVRRLEELGRSIAGERAEVARLAGEVEARETVAIGQREAQHGLRLEAGRAAEDAEEATREIGGRAPEVVDGDLDGVVRAATLRLAESERARADAVRRREVGEAARRHEEAELTADRGELASAEGALAALLAGGSEGAWQTLAEATAARLEQAVADELSEAVAAAEDRSVAARGKLAGAEEALREAAAAGLEAGWTMDRVPLKDDADEGMPLEAEGPGRAEPEDAAWPALEDAWAAAREAERRAQEAEEAVAQEALAESTARTRLAEDAAVRERLAGRLQEVERLREEAARWEAIHRLVGAGAGTGGRPGDAFVRLAQAFQLEELVVRANARLATLSRRYRLAVRHEEGMPTLAFEVRDLEQAGRVRPTTTLSGGESFIVALALALALGDLQGVEMPIETVLIDEGFGTLDAQALGAVLSALESLHATAGVQVGLISHVELLSERIAARVHVEPAGQGRSTVRIG